MFEGGCFCGRIRYELLHAPFDALNCHCADCRRLSGAPFVAWLTLKRGDFRILCGEPKEVASSEPVVRTFCGHCGTPLTYRHAQSPDDIDVTIATLDDPASVPPKAHTWVSERLPWVVLADGLPTFERSEPASAGG